jgi:hypothetical protein
MDPSLLTLFTQDNTVTILKFTAAIMIVGEEPGKKARLLPSTVPVTRTVRVVLARRDYYNKRIGGAVPANSAGHWTASRGHPVVMATAESRLSRVVAVGLGSVDFNHTSVRSHLKR